MKTRNIFGLFLIVFIGSCGIAATQTAVTANSADARKEFRWQGHIAAGQSVEIQGVRGNIRAEAATGDKVEIVATKHGGGDPETVEVKVIEHDGGVMICAIYPAQEGNSGYQCLPNRGDAIMNASASVDHDKATIEFSNGSGGDIQMVDVRVDFVVRIPSGVGFGAVVIDGEISAKGLTGDMIAHSMLGDVKVELSADTNTSVRVETAMGNIESDFPLSIKSGGHFGQSAKGNIGSGGGQIKLRADIGSIMLRRSRPS